MSRTPKFTAEDRANVLRELLRHGGNVSRAAAAIGAHPSTVYYWRRTDPEFDAAYEEAMAFVREAGRAARKQMYRQSIRRK